MSRQHRTRLAAGAAISAMTLLTSVLYVGPAEAGPTPSPRSAASATEKPDTRGVPARGVNWQPPRSPSQKVPAAVWPKPGRTTAAPGTSGFVTVRPQRAGAVARAAAAAAGRFEAEVLDRAATPTAWQSGVITRLTPVGADGAATVAMNYSGFAHAYGGDWSSRLRLYQLPPCALTTPAKPACSAKPLPSSNNAKTQQVSAALTLSTGTLVALAAAPSGDSGDFTATPLSASSTWSAGGSAGDFSWSYPMRVPPVSGPAPTVSLGYSSSSVDGRSEATNNQPSAIGEGFDTQQGFIERSYLPCSDDDEASETTAKGKPNTPTATGDQCWRSWNATLNLDGKTTQLIALPPAKAGDPPTRYRARSESGDIIERLTGATNGDSDGEYWRVTGTDGTQYYFGRNKLPGQGSDTASTWSVPVYGNHPGEPCHDTAFADSDCSQAWRWNLDYVVDRNGNTESLWYDRETNQYATRVVDANHVPYDRGGFLKRIDYGTWDRVTTAGAVDRSVDPAVQITFIPGDRCLTDCATHDEAHWPDTPWDQECKAAATTCPKQYSPTFWSTRRLAAVTTRVWDTTKSPAAWQNVDAWTLTHTFPRSGDGTNRGLWLDHIVHSGEVGTSTPLPPVYFYPQAMANRVLTDSNTTLNWQRLNQIRTESGELITVTYNGPECTDTSLPADASTNTKRCYPTVGPDPQNPGHDRTQWWHKYTVHEVSESDLQLANHQEQPAINTFYDYEGTPAWHYAEDNGLTKPKRLTWNQWRGYRTVAVRVGDTQQTLTRTTYLRGMDGDRESTSGGTRDVTVPASLGSENVRDFDAFAGLMRESVTYNGSTDKPLSKTVQVPWQSGPTATERGVSARFVDVQTTYAATALGENGERGWRTTKSHTTFDDDYGTATTVDDAGDLAATGDELCITNTYNRNTAVNIVTLPKRVLTTALPCGRNPTSADDVIADERSTYDLATSPDTAPTAGALTKTEVLQDWTAAAGTTYRVNSSSTYDPAGREKTATDSRGNLTTSTYTPTGRGPVTSIKTITAKNWTTVTTSAPYWGLTAAVTDPNGRSGEQTFDPLGRVTAVWSSGWPRAAHKNTPSTRYTYCYQPDPAKNPACQATDKAAYTYIKTEALTVGGGYQTKYQIYDALLRLRQTQVTTPNPGERIVTDAIFDSWGRAEFAYAAHAEAGDPTGTLLWKPQWAHRAVAQNLYDRAGRTTAQITLATDNVSNLVEKWRTTTRYAGDRTLVTPPSGGTPTTTISDASGRTVELREHTTATGVDGPYDATAYHYDGRDKLSSVEDTLHNRWSYTYDAKGRLHTSKDPDAGTTTNEYSVNDDLTSTKDGAGHMLAYKYDSIGRRTGVYDGIVSDATQRAGWTYDKLPDGTTVKGLLTASTRYDENHNAYTSQVESINIRYQPLQVKYLLPAAEGLGTSWSISYGYSDIDGAPTDILYPGVDGMPQENVTTKYDAYSGKPNQLTSLDPSVGTYVSAQTYSSYGEPVKTVRQRATGQRYEELHDYDIATRRLHNDKVTSGTLTNQYANRTYAYNAIGDVTSVTDAPTSGLADTQCFTYDVMRRLTSAWTPQPANAATDTPDSDCKAAPTTAADLGGAAPYWSDWYFDAIGNRTKEVDHKPGADTTLKYAVPGSGPDAIRPHAITTVTSDAPAAADANYDYDDAGNTITRPGQTLGWDPEGHLASVTDTGGKTTYLYDAEGNRLIQRDKTGSTLYLPGLEIHHDAGAAAGALSETRYYSLAGQAVAVRKSTDRKLNWLFNDPQGTASVAVDDLTGKATLRRQTPYGTPRGTVPDNWPGAKGFVGGDLDATGLIHLGAREYDAAIGRFISVDPVQDLNSPQQWNAYSYANDNPISSSDPAGTDPCNHGGGGCHHDGTDPATTTGPPDKCTKNCGTKKKKPPPGCQNSNTCDQHTQTSNDTERKIIVQAVDNPQTRLGKYCANDPAVCIDVKRELKAGVMTPQRALRKLSCGDIPDDMQCGGLPVCTGWKSCLWTGVMIVTTVGSVALDVVLLSQPEFEAPAAGAEAAIIRAEALESEEAIAEEEATLAARPTNGNTAEAARGRAIHNEEFADLMDDMTGHGYGGPETLVPGRGGMAIDGSYTDPGTGVKVPIELKPNNARQIKAGWEQLAKYERQLGSPAGSGQLWVYDVGANGGIYFTRVL